MGRRPKRGITISPFGKRGIRGILRIVGVVLNANERALPGAAKKKALLRIDEEGLRKNFGSVLLSHLVTKEVPSALEGLTSVFGMGTGVSPPLSPPKNKKQ